MKINVTELVKAIAGLPKEPINSPKYHFWVQAEHDIAIHPEEHFSPPVLTKPQVLTFIWNRERRNWDLIVEPKLLNDKQ